MRAHGQSAMVVIVAAVIMVSAMLVMLDYPLVALVWTFRIEIDIHMPGIDGVETARQMRSDPVTCALRLVALTGRGSWDLRKQAMDAGFDEFLSKPIPADVLLRALHG